MLYLVYVLTFLAGILFYMLSPRDDQVNLDAYRAEGFIVSFLAQHQAAKDYMTQWLGFKLDQDSFNLTRNKFLDFFPAGITEEISTYQNNTSDTNHYQKIGTNDDWHYQTSVFCFNNSNNLVACNASSVTGRYLVTYSGNPNFEISPGKYNRPDWWPSAHSNRQRRYGAWRNALTRRTSGSYNCGVLTQVDGQYCVDNGQTVKLKSGQCAQKVPPAIITALGCGGGICGDALFCISRVKQGPEKYYAQGLNAFYDAINNQNTGAEGGRGQISGVEIWCDLIRPDATYNATNVNMGTNIATNSTTGKIIRFPINLVQSGYQDSLFRPFTLTILAQSGASRDNKGQIAEASDTLTFLTLGNNNNSFQLIKNNSNCSVSVSGPALAATKTVNIDDCKVLAKISAITVVGSSSELKIYVDKNEILSIEPSDFSYFASLTTDHIFVSGTNSNSSAYVYGVRYYGGKSLTPDEIEQNLKMDSKRYGFSYE